MELAKESKVAKAKGNEKSEATVDDADEVEEPEEGPETATEGLLEDEDELKDASDPFEAHFADPDDNILATRLKSLEASHWTTQKSSIPRFGNVVMAMPQDEHSKTGMMLSPRSGPSELNLKQKLIGVTSKHRPDFDVLEKNITPSIFGYQDLLYCERSPKNSDSLRRLICLHIVNHVFKFVIIPQSTKRFIEKTLGPEIG